MMWRGVYTSDPRKTEPTFHDAVRRLELATRATDPYRLIGRDVQIIAARD